jgi:hypothetical protein
LKRAKRGRRKINWIALGVGTAVAIPVFLAFLALVLFWWQRSRFEIRAVRVKAKAVFAKTGSNDDPASQSFRSQFLRYEFTAPETGQAYGRDVRIEQTRLSLKQDPQDVEQNGLDVMYDPNDPSWNEPVATAGSRTTRRLIHALICFVALVALLIFTAVATFLPMDVLLQRGESGHTPM